MGPGYCRSGVWRVIASVGDESNIRGETFHKGLGFVVGVGRGVRFWLDSWLGVGPLYSLFPRLFRLAIKNDYSVRDCFELMSGCIIWEVTFKRSLRELEGSQ